MATTYTGWGRYKWSSGPWGQQLPTEPVQATGVSATSAISSVTVTAVQTVTVTVTSVSATTDVGDTGWGRSTWGSAGWGAPVGVTVIEGTGVTVSATGVVAASPISNVSIVEGGGITVGISSRGMGSVEENLREGTLEVQDDFELLCFDFVSTPSTHGAFMSPTGLNEGKIRIPEYKYTNVNNIIRDIICDNTGMCAC